MNPIDVPRCFPADARPSEGQFNSREELATAINAWAAPRGYAFVIQRSTKTASGRSIITLQMGSHCKEGSGIRDWTKEEMMSYIDWDKAENERVEQNVEIEMAEQPLSWRRGMQDIWDAAERGIVLQERWSGGGNPPTNICKSKRRCNYYILLERERKGQFPSMDIVI